MTQGSSPSRSRLAHEAREAAWPKRNAAVVLGNVRTASQMEKVEDVQVLTRALDDLEPLVREHASWALRRAGLPLSGA